MVSTNFQAKHILIYFDIFWHILIFEIRTLKHCCGDVQLKTFQVLSLALGLWVKETWFSIVDPNVLQDVFIGMFVCDVFFSEKR